MAITLYHAPYSRSVRVAWLMEEMGLSYDKHVVPREEFYSYSKSEDYLRINPLGKYPALVDDDLTLVESIAIMEYLMSRYGDGPTAGGLKPVDGTPDYGRYMQWLEFGEAGMGSYVVLLMAHTMLLPEKLRIEAMAKWAARETEGGLSFLSSGLGDKTHICGDAFTAADISIGYMLLLIKLMGRMDAAPQNVQAYWNRLKERPAWQKVSAIKA